MSGIRVTSGWAVGLLLMAPNFASAAWDNVFQLTCCGTPRVSQRACCAPPPPPCCPQTAYVQRSFYQPITAYRPVTTCEPVTTMRTSFYWEPVSTCTYSMYVDPCTGCAQQVATPTTSFQLRSRCDAVTSYVQRVSYQPVTAYRQSFYMEPITITPPCCGTPVAAAAPIMTSPPAPSTFENTSPPPSATPGLNTPPPPLNIGPENRSMPQTTEKTITPNTSAPKVNLLRPEQIASSGTTVSGTVVKNDFRPQPNARIRFVSASGQEAQPVTADGTGRFSVNLSGGAWKIFTEEPTGQQIYHSEITLRGGNRNVMVVGR